MLINCHRGAKTALTLALHSPKLVSNVVAVDNCPINLPIGPDFLRYLEGMATVEQQKVRTHAEADEIIRQFDPVWLRLIIAGNTSLLTVRYRIHQFDSGCWAILSRRTVHLTWDYAFLWISWKRPWDRWETSHIGLGMSHSRDPPFFFELFKATTSHGVPSL